MNVEPVPIPILSGLAEIAASRKAWFCDVWGVLHNGLDAFPSAVEACRAFIRRGGEIILVSNSPRISAPVLDDLHAIGVPEDCFTALVTSGDVTRGFVEAYSTEPTLPSRAGARHLPVRRAEGPVCIGEERQGCRLHRLF